METRHKRKLKEGQEEGKDIATPRSISVRAPVERKVRSKRQKVVSPNTELDKIDTILKHGSIFVALKRGYVTKELLTTWNVERPNKEFQSIVLKALNVRIHNSQVRFDTILTKYKKLPGIRSVFKLGCIHRNNMDNESKQAALESAMFKALQNKKSDDWQYYFSALDPYDAGECKRLRVWMNKASHKCGDNTERGDSRDSSARVPHDKKSIELLLQYDMVSMIPLDLITFQSVDPITSLLERCFKLKHMPETYEYWIHCAHYDYLDLMTRLKVGGWMARRDLFKMSNLKMAYDLFPSIFDDFDPSGQHGLESSFLYKQLIRPRDRSFTNTVTMGDGDIFIDQLNYIVSHLPGSEQFYLRFDGWKACMDIESESFNTEDTMMESVDNYVPFDRIKIPCPRMMLAHNLDKSKPVKCWTITRPEWKFVLQHKINPHTRDPIPERALEVIRDRLRIAEKHPFEPVLKSDMRGHLLKLSHVVLLDNSKLMATVVPTVSSSLVAASGRVAFGAPSAKVTPPPLSLLSDDGDDDDGEIDAAMVGE